MEIIGRIIGINTSDNILNLLVLDKDHNQYNIKTVNSQLVIGKVYIFEVEQSIGERISYRLTKVTEIEKKSLEEQNALFRDFYDQSPLSLEECQSKIENYLNQITNPVIYDITKNLILKHQDAYYLYPAASRMHHHYVGGLAYHTIGMLEMADSFLKNYPYLDKNYLYAGIMLHDIGKTMELSGIQNTEYTLDGQILGHLVMGALEIHQMASDLKYENCEEVKFLEHMLISHHGQPQFGAAKRPMTPEAIALWYIDTIDSKFRVLGEELAKTPSGSFTETIGVLDKIKVYKND